MKIIKIKIIYLMAFFYISVLMFAPVIFVSAQVSVSPKPPDIIRDVPVETSAPISATAAPLPAAAAPRVTASPQTSSIELPSPTASMPPSSTPMTPASSAEETNLGSGGGSLLYVAAALAAVIAGFAVSKIYKSKKENKDDREDRCGSIREFLEQKKKELEEVVRGWPKEKIKEIIRDRVVGELNKNEKARKALSVAESVRAKYDELAGTVEMLQRRYDLCMLKLPSSGNAFGGVIIENSLKDKNILKNLRVEKSRQLADWLLHEVTVSGEQIEKLGQYLDDGPWYMHFWQKGKDDVTVVFKDKNFKIKYSDKSTWDKAVEYGKSIGIPADQLDFSIR